MTIEQPPDEYTKYKSRDPFPEIPPALLNSADIADYAQVVGMVKPFNPANLKPASYEIPFSGTVYWWDADSREKKSQEIASKDDVFKLRSNAIAYVCPDTTFYLPEYIALRFNLRITHVHQGLLLGTGPLVDPGFCGRLLIPLHNLTSNEYTFVHGNGFIWVEFTKLSPIESWRSVDTRVQRRGIYKQFPDGKRFLSTDFYFRQASGDLHIVSSIPNAVSESRESARQAASEAKAAKQEADTAARSADVARKESTNAARVMDRNLAIGLIALAISTVALIFTAVQIAQNTHDAKFRASEESVKVQIDALQKELRQAKELRELSEAASARIDSIQVEVDFLKEKARTKSDDPRSGIGVKRR